MPTERDLIDRAERLLRERLGQGWAIQREDQSAFEPLRFDALWRLTAPDGAQTDVAIEAKRDAYPRDVQRWLQSVRPKADERQWLFVSAFLSERARELLEKENVNYIDMSDNLFVRLDWPSLLIRQLGAESRPDKAQPAGQSLRGAGAGRIVRTLCDYQTPLSSTTVATRARVTPGYVSKTVQLLESEALLERRGKGPSQEISVVEWAELLRRWSRDYRLMESNRCQLYLAPQGNPAFLRELERLASAAPQRRYAVTGSYAAAQRAAVAPPSLLFCFVESPSAVAADLDLLPASGAGNVYLCEPFDPIVFEGGWSENGVAYAAFSQIAADCLSGPDRMPSEGEALLAWMEANEEEWRKHA